MALLWCNLRRLLLIFLSLSYSFSCILISSSKMCCLPFGNSEKIFFFLLSISCCKNCIVENWFAFYSDPKFSLKLSKYLRRVPPTQTLISLLNVAWLKHLVFIKENKKSHSDIFLITGTCISSLSLLSLAWRHDDLCIEIMHTH